MVTFSLGICHSSRYLFGRSGELTSPNYPLSYPAGDLQCTKIIDVPTNTRLVVTFEDFAIGASAGCINNAVIFRTDSTVKTYCTDTIPPTFSTTDRYLRIDFSNTDNPRPRGFKLKWNIMAIEGPTQRPIYPEGWLTEALSQQNCFANNQPLVTIVQSLPKSLKIHFS